KGKKPFSRQAWISGSFNRNIANVCGLLHGLCPDAPATQLALDNIGRQVVVALVALVHTRVVPLPRHPGRTADP
ncbi:MAG: hypothetical protein ABSE63_14445, partial [Thermoguttaceae bacterium]